MAKLKIRINPDPILRQKSKRVSIIDKSIQKLIDDMIETMQEAHGVGLAAVQIGVPLRIIVIQIPDDEAMALINPEIIDRKGERNVIEGCLSIPGYQAEITRSELIKAKAKDRKGKLVRIKATDLLAQCLEHEIDHLNGILYIDYLKDTDQLIKTDQELL
jgi:peptide deformylase